MSGILSHQPTASPSREKVIVVGRPSESVIEEAAN